MPDDTPVLIQNVKNPKRKYIWGLIITLILLIAGAISVRYLFSNELKYSSDFYSSGLRQYEDKNYNAALKSFECVIPLDIIRFALAHGKIEECSKLYLEKEFELAKNAAANQLPSKAITHIDNVLAIDPKNETAIKLKTQYQADVILIAEADAQAKVEAKIKAEAESQANAKNIAETTVPLQVETSKENTQAGEEYAAKIRISISQMSKQTDILAQLLRNYQPTQEWKKQAADVMALAIVIAQQTSTITPPAGYENIKSLYLEGTADLFRAFDDISTGIGHLNSGDSQNYFSRAGIELTRTGNEFNTTLTELNKLNSP